MTPFAVFSLSLRHLAVIGFLTDQGVLTERSDEQDQALRRAGRHLLTSETIDALDPHVVPFDAPLEAAVRALRGEEGLTLQAPKAGCPIDLAAPISWGATWLNGELWQIPGTSPPLSAARDAVNRLMKEATARAGAYQRHGGHPLVGPNLLPLLSVLNRRLAAVGPILMLQLIAARSSAPSNDR